jgi:hypothetical protein
VWGRVILFFESTHYISLKYAVGQGTNNQVEFYALWLLLENNNRQRFKTIVGILRFQDVDDWANNKCKIENMLLAPIMNQVLEVKIVLMIYFYSYL